MVSYRRALVEITAAVFATLLVCEITGEMAFKAGLVWESPRFTLPMPLVLRITMFALWLLYLVPFLEIRWRLVTRRRWIRVALGVNAGGLSANLYELAVYGAIRDFIQLDIWAVSVGDFAAALATIPLIAAMLMGLSGRLR